jgi:hypothetical protein
MMGVPFAPEGSRFKRNSARARYRAVERACAVSSRALDHAGWEANGRAHAGWRGPALRQFCLALHTQGQVTTERLMSILNGIGVEISKTSGRSVAE